MSDEKEAGICLGRSLFSRRAGKLSLDALSSDFERSLRTKAFRHYLTLHYVR